MKNYKIVYLQSELKSFSWDDGLFVIINKSNGIYNLCKLNKHGNLQTYEDGTLAITCTGINNKGIQETNLIYKENEKKFKIL